MPKSRQSRTKHTQEILPTSQKLDVIDKLLQKMLDAYPAKGRITTEEVQDWHKDLTPFSVAAIEFAFESHRRNAIFFPLYPQIIDLCISYDPPDQQVRTNANCDAICRARHGKGYNSNDMMWLFHKMQQAYATGDVPDTEALMTQLDAKRHGGAPEWRKSDL